ncbi:MAG: hypothetical protein ACI4OZ_02805, partial [Akkermansia sp.]
MFSQKNRHLLGCVIASKGNVVMRWKRRCPLIINSLYALCIRNAVDFPRPKVESGQLSMRISVIITSYNYGRFIGETLKAIQ